MTAEHFHRQFDLNVLGLILTTQEAAKHFGPDGGSVVNISSIVSGTFAVANASVYSATKAAVDAVTRSLSKELGPRKIRVNAINPGMIETEGFRAAGIGESEMRKQTEAATPLGRIGQPQDIAPAAVYFASSDSAWVTGETLYITGGLRYGRHIPSQGFRPDVRGQCARRVRRHAGGVQTHGRGRAYHQHRQLQCGADASPRRRRCLWT